MMWDLNEGEERKTLEEKKKRKMKSPVDFNDSKL